MDDRNENRFGQQGDESRSTQSEQWDDTSYRQSGTGFNRHDERGDNRWQTVGRTRERAFDSGSRPNPQFDRGSDRMTGRDHIRGTERIGRDWDRDGGYYSEDERGETYGYRPGRYDRRADRGYGRFTSESYGGRDFADTARAPYYGYAAGTGTGGMGARYPSPDNYSDAGRGYDRDRYGERSFLERAGDEVASWFGDEDAARRREMDHRGNGPQGYTRSDERILEDACDRLTEDRDVDARNITVSVQEGELTLSGTVSDKRAKREAEDCVDNVSGVSHVQNNLRVVQASDQL